jgi:hypothetical protein
VLPVTAVGKIFKPNLRKRAIEDAFNKALTSSCSDISFVIDVIDDKKLGIKVNLSIKDGKNKDDIATRVNDALQNFTQTWELLSE